MTTNQSKPTELLPEILERIDLYCERNNLMDVDAEFFRDIIISLFKQPTQHVQSEKRICVKCGHDERWLMGGICGHFDIPVRSLQPTCGCKCEIGSQHVQSPSGGARAAALEIVNDHLAPCAHCFGDAMPDVQRAIEAIIAAHVPSASLTDAIKEGNACLDLVKRWTDWHISEQQAFASAIVTLFKSCVAEVLDQWNGDYDHYAISGAPTGQASTHLEGANEFAARLITTLQSLEGKAPVGESTDAAEQWVASIYQLLVEAGGKMHPDKRIREATDRAMLFIAKGSNAATTPSSGEE